MTASSHMLAKTWTVKQSDGGSSGFRVGWRSNAILRLRGADGMTEERAEEVAVTDCLLSKARMA